MLHIDSSLVSISSIHTALRPLTSGLDITRKTFRWILPPCVSALCLCQQISVHLFPCLQLVGLVKLSLHQFYLAFSEQSSADLCLEGEVRRREGGKWARENGESMGGEERRGREGEREVVLFVFPTSLRHI